MPLLRHRGQLTACLIVGLLLVSSSSQERIYISRNLSTSTCNIFGDAADRLHRLPLLCSLAKSEGEKGGTFLDDESISGDATCSSSRPRLAAAARPLILQVSLKIFGIVCSLSSIFSSLPLKVSVLLLMNAVHRSTSERSRILMRRKVSGRLKDPPSPTSVKLSLASLPLDLDVLSKGGCWSQARGSSIARPTSQSVPSASSSSSLLSPPLTRALKWRCAKRPRNLAPSKVIFITTVGTVLANSCGRISVSWF